MKCDVVVIGAGPGGSMAAKTAAESGLNVVLLEKRQEIGEPIRCAEGVSIRSELRELIKVQPDWISTEVNGVRMYSPNGDNVFTTVDSRKDEGGYILERKIFDRGLALQAAYAGAKVLVKTRAIGLIRKNSLYAVSAICRGEPLQIEAPLIIGADGVESKVARWAGIGTRLKPEDIMVCAEYQVLDDSIDQEYCEFFFGNGIAPGGYVWIFPKGGRLANVGIGIQGSQSGSGEPVRLLERFLQSKMPHARILQMVAGGIPTSGPMNNTTSDGVMLVGDAAHQSDPLTGGGIINAMKAGIMAGETAGKAVSSGDVSTAALKEYEDRWRSSIGKQIERRYHAKNFFLKLTDDDLNHLAKSLHGKDLSRMNARDLLSFLFKQNPKMLWRLVF
ncbi:MAG: NAD(P)/FAD-dependent oxidoreductase [Methanothrix sp.]|jgi:digeranylgeranylglycerophospholipid reductase|nr:NAD(P)/FAD-dependent oxidoreductase [Methanothrix sp.]